MRNRLRLPALAIVSVILATACGGAATPSPSSGGSSPAASTPPVSGGASAPAASGSGSAGQGIDDGTKITMWTRAATEARARPLVEAYNASHKNQVELTVVPTDDYQAKVGAAAGSSGLPDLFSADVVFMPNWTSQGLFQDITSKIDGLPYADKIAQAHIVASTWEARSTACRSSSTCRCGSTTRRSTGRPGSTRRSRRRRSRSSPTQARAVAKLGGDIHGTFFGGNCGGCEVFTWWPIAWADGEQVMNAEGTESHAQQRREQEDLLDLQVARRRRHRLDAGLQDRDRPDLDRLLPERQRRHHAVAGDPDRPRRRQPQARGRRRRPRSPASRAAQSTFVGGDGIGISRDSKVPDQAWNFLAWLEDEDAQVNVIAKGGNVVSRTDLANNQYSSGRSAAR